MYKPSKPFITTAILKIPVTKVIKGVPVPTYTEYKNPLNGAFYTFGGTEKITNDIVTVINTATYETWYNPAITSGCLLAIDGVNYEIIGDPEDIEHRHIYHKLKLQRIKGGA